MVFNELSITLLGMVINVFLAVFKILFGVFGNSSALIADGVHSFSDLITDVVAYFGVKWSLRPADNNHNFGHGKIETFSAFVISVLLLITSLVIGYEAVLKFMLFIQSGRYIEPDISTAIVALISVIVKELLFRITYKVGSDAGLETIKANAYHHRSDALSSVAVFIGIMIAIIFGGQFAVLDPITAFIVSIAIFVVSLRIVKNSIYDLLEGALPDVVIQEVKEIIMQVGVNVKGVKSMKTRRVGNHFVFDIVITMDGEMSLKDTHKCTEGIETAVKRKFKNAYVLIHVEPDG